MHGMEAPVCAQAESTVERGAPTIFVRRLSFSLEKDLSIYLTSPEKLYIFYSVRNCATDPRIKPTVGLLRTILKTHTHTYCVSDEVLGVYYSVLGNAVREKSKRSRKDFYPCLVQHASDFSSGLFAELPVGEVSRTRIFCGSGNTRAHGSLKVFFFCCSGWEGSAWVGLLTRKGVAWPLPFERV